MCRPWRKLGAATTFNAWTTYGNGLDLPVMGIDFVVEMAAPMVAGMLVRSRCHPIVVRWTPATGGGSLANVVQLCRGRTRKQSSGMNGLIRISGTWT